MKTIKTLGVIYLITLGLVSTSYASIDKNLKYEQRDKEVTELQEFLINKGLLKTTLSDFFDTQTLKAVKAYQKNVGISPTGFVGGSTREKINKEISKTEPKLKTTKEKVVTQQSAAIKKEDTQYNYYSVTSVVDGDTVKVNINGKIETIRLIGLDTPETVDPRKPVQCFGKEASNKAKELLTGNKIRIEKDVTQGDKDKYSRTLAYIYTEDGIFYNKYMIEKGYAHEYTYNIPYKYQEEFKLAQKNAQTNKIGLWSPDTCNGETVPPSTTKTNTTVTNVIGTYYTSSASNATKYYPESCSEWQKLSKNNLKTFNTLEDLLAVYPNRILASTCK